MITSFSQLIAENSSEFKRENNDARAVGSILKDQYTIYHASLVKMYEKFLSNLYFPFLLYFLPCMLNGCVRKVSSENREVCN